jgi:hypothetical protein
MNSEGLLRSYALGSVFWVGALAIDLPPAADKSAQPLASCPEI